MRRISPIMHIILLVSTLASAFAFHQVGLTPTSVCTERATDTFATLVAPQNGTYTCQVGPNPINAVGDVVLGIVYWDISPSLAGDLVRVSAATNGHDDMAVEIWNGFIKNNETEWWSTNGPKLAGSDCMPDPSVTWWMASGNYTLAFAHWPFSCGCNEFEINITYTLEVFSPAFTPMLEPVEVNITVEDANGAPIKSAQVKAFSDDWFIRYPDYGHSIAGREDFVLTDESGRATFNLVAGNWSFFAGAGEEYQQTHEGLGYFTVLDRLTIDENSSYTMRPTSSINVTIQGFTSEPLDGYVRVMTSEYVPMIWAPYCGKTSGGFISIQANLNSTHDILFMKPPFGGMHGCLIVKEAVYLGQSVSIQLNAVLVNHVTINVRNATLHSTQGFLRIRMYGFSIDGFMAEWEIADDNGFYITPGKFWCDFTLVQNGWGFTFYGNEYDPPPGSELTLYFGGPMLVSIRTMLLGNSPEVWLVAEDSHGNVIKHFHDTMGREHALIELFETGGTIFSENIGEETHVHADTVSTPWLQIRLNRQYTISNSPTYRLDLDFGPFGFFNLTGILLGNDTLLEIENIETTHFSVFSPLKFHDKFDKVTSWLESAYDAMHILMNETLTELINVEFHICAGFWAGRSHIWFNIGDVLEDHYRLGASLAMGGGLLHELAHIFQGSPSNIAPTCENGWIGVQSPNWFGEPFASMLAADAVKMLLGERVGNHALGERLKLSIEYYDGTKNLYSPFKVYDFQHYIYSLLEGKYNKQIHEEMAKQWSDDHAAHFRRRLIALGFTSEEALITLYSSLAKENLAWLYRMGGVYVTNERIGEALVLANDNNGPTTLHDYDGAWHNADFSITLTATDGESGVAETYYKINNGSTRNVSVDGQPRIITEASNNTLEYWSVDNADNEELPYRILMGIKLDKTAPVIGIPSREPASDVQPNQPVKVSTNASDAISRVENVTLCYTLSNGTTWEEPLSMELNASTDLREATIPGQPIGTLVEFKITAYDFSGNNATKDGIEPYCTYQVVPEFPSFLVASLLIMATLTVTFTKLEEKRGKHRSRTI